MKRLLLRGIDVNRRNRRRRHLFFTAMKRGFRRAM
jgi:hypothetical protein